MLGLFFGVFRPTADHERVNGCAIWTCLSAGGTNRSDRCGPSEGFYASRPPAVIRGDYPGWQPVCIPLNTCVCPLLQYTYWGLEMAFHL
jgi:hypothetical protein